VEQEWEKTAELRSNVDLDVYAIIPNHFHAIFFIVDTVGTLWGPESGANGQSNESPTDNMAHVKNRAHVGAPLGPRGSLRKTYIGNDTY
jgi:hypothetical protein